MLLHSALSLADSWGESWAPFCSLPPYLSGTPIWYYPYIYLFDADPLSVASTSCPSLYHLTRRVSLSVLVLLLTGRPALGSVSEGFV